MLRGGGSGIAAIVPGKPDQSYLLDVISHRDPDLKMPPESDRIPEKEINLLTQWIQQGAIWPVRSSGLKIRIRSLGLLTDRPSAGAGETRARKRD